MLIRPFHPGYLGVICTYATWICVVNALCPPFNSTNRLRFQIEPPKVISSVDGRFTTLQCCVEGYTELRWFFRLLNIKVWKIKKENVQFDDGNRTLNILRPVTYIETGFYLCEAHDQHGFNVSRSIFVYFLNADQTKNIQAKEESVAPRTNYYPGDDASFKCKAVSYEPKQRVLVTWQLSRRNITSSITRKHTISTVFFDSNNRTGETNPDLIEIESCLQLPNVNSDDEGKYICTMEQNNQQMQEEFLLSLNDDRFKWWLLLGFTISTIALLGSGILIWFYHYDIIILYKSYLDPCPSGQRRIIDVSFLYEDRDDDCLRISIDIVHSLEKFGLRCWLYDRNKTFGGEKTDDYARVMRQSHVLLVLTSTDSTELLKILALLPTDPGVKRLYFFIPNKKVVYKTMRTLDCDILRWMNQELKLQSFLQRNSTDLDDVKGTKTIYYQLTTWIIASIPSLAIREAKERMSNIDM